MTVDDIPEAFRTQHESVTVHGLLASFLAFGTRIEEVYGPWSSTWPTISEFRKIMPLCWSQHGASALTEGLLATLDERGHAHMSSTIERFELRARDPVSNPEPMCGFLQAQRKRLKADWELVSSIFPDAAFENYLHKWLVVNTRSLYYELPTAKTPPPRDDCMVLCP